MCRLCWSAADRRQQINPKHRQKVHRISRRIYKKHPEMFLQWIPIWQWLHMEKMQKQPLMRHRQRLSVWTHFYLQEMQTARSQNWTQMEVQIFPKMQAIWQNAHWNFTRRQTGRLILQFIRWWKHGDSQHRTFRFRHRRHWINFFHSLMREIFLMTKKRERYLSAWKGWKSISEELQKDIPHPELWTFTKTMESQVD